MEWEILFLFDDIIEGHYILWVSFELFTLIISLSLQFYSTKRLFSPLSYVRELYDDIETELFNELYNLSKYWNNVDISSSKWDSCIYSKFCIGASICPSIFKLTFCSIISNLSSIYFFTTKKISSDISVCILLKIMILTLILEMLT